MNCYLCCCNKNISYLGSIKYIITLSYLTTSPWPLIQFPPQVKSFSPPIESAVPGDAAGDWIYETLQQQVCIGHDLTSWPCEMLLGWFIILAMHFGFNPINPTLSLPPSEQLYTSWGEVSEQRDVQVVQFHGTVGCLGPCSRTTEQCPGGGVAPVSNCRPIHVP